MRDKTFGFLVFDDLEELDLVGPWELVRAWSAVADGPGRCLLVGASTAPVRCAKGLRLLPDLDFAGCPELDWLLIPGGDGRRAASADPATLAFVRRQAAGASAVLSVCTGAFVLKAAGLLEGRPATTHWSALAELRATGVSVVEERYVRADPIWTAAGVSAGMDMTLAFIAATAGEDAASATQLYAEYYPEPRRYGDHHRRPEAPGYLRE